MPKPNYQFEKRQRELAKKQKKEEKAQRRSSPQQPGTDADAATDAGGEAPAPASAETGTPGQGA